MDGPYIGANFGFMKHLTLLGIILFFSADVLAQKDFAVLELFTSEGCYSCPPREKEMASLSESNADKNVVFIARHVTYWDYLGWKDIYGDVAHDNQQTKYSRKINSTTRWTPMYVYNGNVQSKAFNIDLGKADVDLSVNLKELTDNKLTVSYTVSKELSSHRLKVFLLEDNIERVILSGENAGKTLIHQNVSRNLSEVSVSKTTGTVSLYIPNDAVKENLKVVAYISDANLDIVAATTGFGLSTASVNNETLQSLSIYPNPAKNQVFVSANLQSELDYSLQLIDSKGTLIYVSGVKNSSTLREELNVAELQSGVYLLKLSVGREFVTRKVIIE